MKRLGEKAKLDAAWQVLNGDLAGTVAVWKEGPLSQVVLGDSTGAMTGVVTGPFATRIVGLAKVHKSVDTRNVAITAGPEGSSVMTQDGLSLPDPRHAAVKEQKNDSVPETQARPQAEPAAVAPPVPGLQPGVGGDVGPAPGALPAQGASITPAEVA